MSAFGKEAPPSTSPFAKDAPLPARRSSLATEAPSAADAPTALVPIVTSPAAPGPAPAAEPPSVPPLASAPDPMSMTGPIRAIQEALAPDEQVPRSRQRALARARTRQRNRRLMVLGILLAAVALIGLDVMNGGHLPGSSPAPQAAVPTRTTAQPTAPASSVAVPESGPGTFAYVSGTGPVIGSAGTIRKYRVAVENGSGQDASAFAAIAQHTLSDPRGWIKGGDVRFQQVAQHATAEFTIYLATPATSEKMCSQGGIHTDELISCRVPGQVIINLARWLNAIPGYGASVVTYQQFTLNHEVGRELGHSDEACPAPGALASVMQEQTLGLKGCKANAWPYVNGVRYSGPAVPS
ncbi:hypothetical protein GCM10023322_53640 [Rugosimonospora acidiphila]|uniref:DUF3152 domain-containing protein n=1 Tax=Rugosimonospora acidiphila TaxID=556531 RepID=A0ABP9S9R1_9ACTN